MPTIETIKNVFISNTNGANQTSFEQEILLGFVPDEVILREAIWLNDGTKTDIVVVRTSLISERKLCTLLDNRDYLTSGQVFKLGIPVETTYQFSYTTPSGAALAPEGTVCLHLQFVKYNNKKRI